MGLSIGIVGLPNVGKSTTFNALVKEQAAQSANYPFCTIEPNKANVKVPDSRIDALAKLINPQAVQYSMLEFVDIAGLVKGASRGEGLGNQFLANIKETDAILHIVRCFANDDITHVEGRIDPIGDIEIIELELVLSDLASLEKKIEKLNKQLKSSKDTAAVLEIAMKLKSHFEKGLNARSFPDRESEHFITLNNELRFLSAKSVIYGANVNEDELLSDNEAVLKLKEYASKEGSSVIKLCAKVEEELIGLNDEEREEFLRSLGVEESSLSQVIREGFRILGLISYFTAGVKEVRAWTIRRGDKAPKAASVIHKDFEKGFIRAETIGYDDFIKYGGESGAKAAGAMRVEGKDYVVNDGDIMHFRFNV